MSLWARRISSTMRQTIAVMRKSIGLKTAATLWARRLTATAHKVIHLTGRPVLVIR
jgi:hypothetical protein